MLYASDHQQTLDMPVVGVDYYCLFFLLGPPTNTICDAYPMAFTLGLFYQAIRRFFIWVHFSIWTGTKVWSIGVDEDTTRKNINVKVLSTAVKNLCWAAFSNLRADVMTKKCISLALHCNMICTSCTFHRFFCFINCGQNKTVLKNMFF